MKRVVLISSALLLFYRYPPFIILCLSLPSSKHGVLLTYALSTSLEKGTGMVFRLAISFTKSQPASGIHRELSKTSNVR